MKCENCLEFHGLVCERPRILIRDFRGNMSLDFPTLIKCPVCNGAGETNGI